MQKSFDFSANPLQKLAQADVARALAEDVGDGDLTAGLIDATRRPAPACCAAKAP
jgi:nicotinate-nucleotide pyrophosphorylase (carboxylating)